MDTIETIALEVILFSLVTSDKKSYVARIKRPDDTIKGTEKM